MKNTYLYPQHQSLGAKFTAFSGYQMPVWYSSLNEEHLAVRKHAGIFDVSHMGPIVIQGPQAKVFLQKMLSNDVEKCGHSKQIYHFVLNEEGFPLDDVMLAPMAEDTYLLVANAGNKDVVLDWFQTHIIEGVIVERLDESHSFLALQGPAAVALAYQCFGKKWQSLKRFEMTKDSYQGSTMYVSRSGYTGEDGLEVLLPSDQVADFWEAALSAGFTPCGLAARDTLRIEAGMPLYGQEISLTVHPLQSRFAFAVDFSTDFIGKDALQVAKEKDDYWRCVGFEMDSKRIPRPGAPIVGGGVVTSGTKSPLTQRILGMALVPKAYQKMGQQLVIDLRGVQLTATVVKVPFSREVI